MRSEPGAAQTHNENPSLPQTAGVKAGQVGERALAKDVQQVSRGARQWKPCPLSLSFALFTKQPLPKP